MKIAICDDEQKICDLIKNKIEDALTKACEGLRIRQLFLDDRGTRFENEKNRIDMKKLYALVSVSVDHAEYFKRKYGVFFTDEIYRMGVRIIRERTGEKAEIFLLQACDSAQGEKIVHRIRQVEDKIQLQDIPVGAAYGMAEAKSPEDLETAISQADQAMYADKRKVKGQCRGDEIFSEKKE